MISEIQLLNIKSFKNVTIPLGRFTLVVGTNAAGKSNLRDALRFMHGMGLGFSVAEVLGDTYGPGGILQWRGIRGGLPEIAYLGATSWSLTARLSPDGDQQAIDWSLQMSRGDERDGPRVDAEQVQTGDAAPLSTQLNPFFPITPPRRSISGRTVRLPVPIEYTRSSLGQWATTAADHGGSARAARITVALQSMRFLDLDPEAMRQPSAPGQVILGDRGENLSSVLLAICDVPSQKETLLSWVRSLTPMDAVDLEFVSVFGGKVLLHLVEASGRKTSALSASDGTLRFLALVAALLSSESGRFFFLEEMDNGIHPTRLPLLLDLIQRTCKERDIQVVATTHNPALLGFLDEEARNDALLIYRVEEAPDSRVRRIADLPGFAEVLQKQDLGALHISGWLETAAIMSDGQP